MNGAADWAGDVSGECEMWKKTEVKSITQWNERSKSLLPSAWHRRRCPSKASKITAHAAVDVLPRFCHKITKQMSSIVRGNFRIFVYVTWHCWSGLAKIFAVPWRPKVDGWNGMALIREIWCPSVPRANVTKNDTSRLDWASGGILHPARLFLETRRTHAPLLSSSNLSRGTVKCCLIIREEVASN